MLTKRLYMLLVEARAGWNRPRVPAGCMAVRDELEEAGQGVSDVCGVRVAAAIGSLPEVHRRGEVVGLGASQGDDGAG